jgi:hypothetical protein
MNVNETKLLVRLPSVKRGCNGKINLGRSYAKQADKLAEKHCKYYGVYRCHHCGGTHLTTKLDKSESYAPLIHTSEPNSQSNKLKQNERTGRN